MTQIQIEHNIPLPARPKQVRKGRNRQYDFAPMEVGDSFAIPIPEGKGADKVKRNILISARAHSRQCGLARKYKADIDPLDANRVRLWRVG